MPLEIGRRFSARRLRRLRDGRDNAGRQYCQVCLSLLKPGNGINIDTTTYSGSERMSIGLSRNHPQWPCTPVVQKLIDAPRDAVHAALSSDG